MSDMDLVEFLTARLDEDEDMARDAGREAWRVDSLSSIVVDPGGDLVFYGDGQPSSGQAAHMARHDPARVLREAEAKRAIVHRYARKQSRRDEFPNLTAGEPVAALRLTVMDLAAVYADHPDWREEWRP